ncbi:MAG: hypothetical protein JO308_07610 [Verrucomicrobia bacterium]|nr:hypothetical protein [Verrucomicrobiota bacterium]
MLERWVNSYLLQSRRVWRRLPDSVKNLGAGRAYGRHLHALVCQYSKRNQNHSTFFLRNRPEMEMICRLLSQKPYGSTVAISVLGCSKGAEVYSILWTIRKWRPDLKVTLQAVDISQEIVDFAAAGVYSLKTPGVGNSSDQLDATKEDKLVLTTCKDQGPGDSWSIFERLSDAEMEAMFDRAEDHAKIKSWIKEGTIWRVGDACASELVEVLGPQDIVVANRFLCHMEPPMALKCLRNIGAMVKPGGYIFVSGVDLDVRTKVAKEMDWEPVRGLIKEIYEGDFSLATGWPFEWWGLEPFCESRPDWRIRYASVFQIGKASDATKASAEIVGSALEACGRS